MESSDGLPDRETLLRRVAETNREILRAMTGPLPLSDREKQILQLLADGNRLDAVACKMQPEISEQVVKNRLVRIREKLGVTTTIEGIALGFRGGWLA